MPYGISCSLYYPSMNIQRYPAQMSFWITGAVGEVKMAVWLNRHFLQCDWCSFAKKWDPLTSKNTYLAGAQCETLDGTSAWPASYEY